MTIITFININNLFSSATCSIMVLLFRSMISPILKSLLLPIRLYFAELLKTPFVIDTKTPQRYAEFFSNMDSCTNQVSWSLHEVVKLHWITWWPSWLDCVELYFQVQSNLYCVALVMLIVSHMFILSGAHKLLPCGFLKENCFSVWPN